MILSQNKISLLLDMCNSEVWDLKLRFSTIVVILSVIITSCGAPVKETQINIILSANEKWEASYFIAFTEESFALIESQLSQELDKMVSQAKEKDIDMEWHILERFDGNIPFVINIKSKGYQQLGQVNFGDENVIRIIEKNKQKTLVFELENNNELFLEAASRSLSISGGKVISHNGIKVDENTVRWNNPTGVMYAELEMPGIINWLPYSLILLGVILILASIRTRSNRSSSSSTQNLREQLIETNIQTKHCHNCETEMKIEALFCPVCGEKQKIYS